MNLSRIDGRYLQRVSPRLAGLAVLLVAAAVAAVVSYLLWRQAPLYAALLCGFVLFGAARSLPPKQGLAYCACLGFGLGLFVGGAAGAAKLLF